MHKLAALSSRRLTRLFGRFGESDYIGEKCSILQHSILAANLAKESGESLPVQLGALFHDVGHLLEQEAGFKAGMNGLGAIDHDLEGSKFLKQLGLSDEVQACVANHVKAKRYQCTKDPKYVRRLTPASRQTLEFQGGLMTEEELSNFEKDPYFEQSLRVRTYDDKGKNPDAKCPGLSYYEDLVAQHIVDNQTKSKNPVFLEPIHKISAYQRSFYNKEGYIIVRDVDILTREFTHKDYDKWTNEVKNDKHPDLIHHIEVVDNSDNSKSQLHTRSEYFVHRHQPWNLIANNILHSIVTQFVGESRLFKEKVNFKPAGGAGFAPHQDSTAYSEFVNDVVSVLLAIDPMNSQNGPLFVAPASINNVEKWEILPNSQGKILPEVAEKLKYEQVTCDPGTIVLFNGYTPHKAPKNESDSERRAVFLTYALGEKAKDDQIREKYYAAKRKHMKSGWLSFNDDFDGKLVK